MAEVVTRMGPLGMVSLRGDLGEERLRVTVSALTGTAMPGRLRIEGTSGRGAAWMSPDELLIFLPPEEAPAAVRRLSEELEGLHHLVADVSAMRVGLRLDGPGAREVLAKLSPADLHPDAFGPGVVRRSRLGQVAAAFWLEGDGARVICFRSMGDYALALLRQSAKDGAVGYFGA
ncbi:sarcosine oxidase subunit gamma [Rubellimicrobium aerolatum]|uniref:Sarcosine oxidase subunit gamma n=1 Tax=Rubellimicrobium aerolatum TaxID=490979 RepID=A0ABW0SBR3_9RHOB|nr:sarcosine oxidase subunit gamma family protein [Rubellimicrobium aerolatum]MBP1805563.1 sarcosine oxidase subunit gamma [Rubellimicrobium aerolatum]